MNLENQIKDVINQKMMDGTVEKLVSQELEKGVQAALDNLFRSYGDVTKIIENQIKSVIVPYLENYDYSRYITKLDSVLVEVLQNTTNDNKVMLENFKDLMSMEEDIKEIKVTDLFNKWIKYVESNVSTDDLEINYDDGVSYESVEVRMEVEENEDRSWSSFARAVLVFECDHDEEMNFQIELSRYKKSRDEGWDIRYNRTPEIKSLRHLSDFEIFLMRLDQSHARVILDETYETDDVYPDAEPEATFY